MFPIPFLSLEFIFYLVGAGIPAYFMNRYLIQLIQPRQSIYRFVAYLIVILAAAFLYTFIICWVLLKYVWKGL